MKSHISHTPFKRFFTFSLLLSWALGLSHCSSNESNTAAPTIVCTTNIVADLVQQLAPDSIAVYSIMGAGVDPHIYKPKPADIGKLQQATVIFYNGLHLEGKMAEILENLSSQKKVFALADGVKPEKLIRAGDFTGGIDPHIWFDPEIWLDAAQYVRAKLTAAFPAQTDEIDQKFASYSTQLQKELSNIEESITKIDSSKRILVTAHDAFSYFCRKYNFELISIQGLSTQADFSVKTIDSISNYLVERKVPCAFFETSVSTKSIETLLTVCQQKGWTVKPGGTLFSDALGAKNSEAGTYMGMFKHNCSEISNCLNSEE